MKLSKEISILDNDIYVLVKSQNYIIVNDDYKGLKVYNHNLKYVTSIMFEEELVINQIFSTRRNDKIVISDIENEKMFIVDLSLNNASIIMTNRTENFSEYFYAKDDYFCIKDAVYTYKIFFEDGSDIDCRKHFSLNILANNECELIYEENGELFYSSKSSFKKLKNEYNVDKFYSVSNEIILEYDENEIIISNLFKILNRIKVNLSWMIRKVIIEENEFFVLINHKKSIYESVIQKYEL